MARFSTYFSAGLLGATALTLAHEVTRHFASRAPRADLLGMRALRRGFRAAGVTVPNQTRLRGLALVLDVVSNGVFYAGASSIGWRKPMLSGVTSGALMGLGAVTLPGPLGLGTGPTSKSGLTRMLTVGLYALGGLVTGYALTRDKETSARLDEARGRRLLKEQLDEVRSRIASREAMLAASQ